MVPGGIPRESGIATIFRSNPTQDEGVRVTFGLPRSRIAMALTGLLARAAARFAPLSMTTSGAPAPVITTNQTARDGAPLRQLSEHLFAFEDTCNVYLVTSGEAGLLVDVGSGAVARHIAGVGVTSLEWVLHTHHHRDQCWGTPRLAAEHGAQVAVPEHERHLFEQRASFWQTRRTFDNYNDRNTFFTHRRGHRRRCGAGGLRDLHLARVSVLRLAGQGAHARVERADRRVDGRSSPSPATCWRPAASSISSTRWSTPTAPWKASCSRCSRSRRCADASRTCACLRTARRSRRSAPTSTGSKTASWSSSGSAYSRHGARTNIRTARAALIPLSAHLLWGGVWTCSNFYVVLSDSGKALFVDYGHAFWPHMHIGPDHDGLESMRFVEHHLDELREEYGVSSFDLVVPTHIHDDHTCGIPYLQRHHGTRCWALEEVGQVLADPAAWTSTPCTFPKPIRIDRAQGRRDVQLGGVRVRDPLRTGADGVPLGLRGLIDGRKVAFTGDNYFLAEVDERRQDGACAPYQTTVLRNSFQLGMHRRCAEVMRKIAPELICPGHRDVLPCFKGPRHLLRLHRPQGAGLPRAGRRTGRPLHRPVLGSSASLLLDRRTRLDIRIHTHAPKQPRSPRNLRSTSPAAGRLGRGC